MEPKRAKVIVVMPAYNAAATIERTIADIPHAFVDEIVLVDDCSTDDTLAIAERLAQTHPNLSEVPLVGRSLFTRIAHASNRGYGGNQKTCYDYALSRNGDVIVMIHPDYQYDPKQIVPLCEPLLDGTHQVMLGSRIRNWSDARVGGMPVYKYIANRFLTSVQNVVTGRQLSEWHTGMRAYTRDFLEAAPYGDFSEDFVFDAQILLHAVRSGNSIGEIPVAVRYFAEASSINFKRSTEYGLRTMYYTLGYGLERSRQLISYLFAGGTGYLVNLGLYAVLINLFNVWYPVAAGVAVVAGLCTSFVLQKLWTFKSQRSRLNTLREAALYALTGAINIVLVSHLVYWLVEYGQLGVYVSAVIANAAAAFWSYFLYKYIIFSRAVSHRQATREVIQ